ncbi:MAG: MFS transporter [Salibacteraceae bacterium]
MPALKHERLILYLFAATQFTHIMDFMIIMPLGEMLMEELNIGAKQFAWLVASYTITAGVSGFLSAFIVDSFDRKRFFITAYLGFAIGTVLCGLAGSYETLSAARVFTGVFGGVLSSTVLTIVSDVVAPERRAWGIGVVMTAFSLASALGLPLGLSAAFTFGWQVPFVFLGIVSLILSAGVAWVLPPVRSHLMAGGNRKRSFEFIKNIPRNKNQWMGLLFTMLLVFGQFTVIPFITPYLVENVGFTRQEITLVYLIGGIVTIVSNPRIGKWADATDRFRVFGLMAAFSIVPLLLLTNLPRVPIWLALIVNALFFFAISGRMVPSTTIVTTLIRPENRGSFMSLNTSVQNLTAGISSIIAGWLVYVPKGGGEVSGFWRVGLVAVVFTLIAIWMMSRLKRVESPTGKVQ